MAKKVKTETRSYTLRLAPTSDAEDSNSLWQRLFLTHEAVCQGAAEFGELFLNLRGGMSPSLADVVDDDLDEDQRTNAIRGRRRMLALGWLSVENERGARTHPFRIDDVPSGESLSREYASELLRSALALKGITSPDVQLSWILDCVDALTSRVREAVWVNRAAAFQAWQTRHSEIAAEMPDHARCILLRLCGNNFIDLKLPDDANVISSDAQESAEDEGADPTMETAGGSTDEEAADPNKASRRIFGELFGGDAAAKQDRAKGKTEFAFKLQQCLQSRDSRQPLHQQLTRWRDELKLPPLDTLRPEKYPNEVASSGAPTAIAKRYRKLLVSLDLWPASDDESGKPRLQARDKYEKQVSGNVDGVNVAINVLDILAACDSETKSPDGEADANQPTSQSVFKPAWAIEYTDPQKLGERLSPAVLDSSASEFRRLMFALAARRISQTQTWTRRNEEERHKAAVKKTLARSKLDELDLGERARQWLVAYEHRRGELTGAENGFRITKRAIAECARVFSSWEGLSTPEARDEQTVKIQQSSEKFGDPALFFDLSYESGAEVVWCNDDGTTTHELLEEWVKFRQAEDDQGRLKIPRYCHPNPFHHPTWCEFGGSSKPKVWYELAGKERPSRPEPGGDADGLQRMWLLLPNFQTNEARATPLRWRSKRLKTDFGVSTAAKLVSGIPRGDRSSLAAAGACAVDTNGKPIPIRPSLPFSENASSWNARLQVDRAALTAIEHLWDRESRQWLDGGRALRRLRWFVTFAPSLEVASGPMRELLDRLNLKKLPIADWNKKQKREGRAKLILSRLTNLRILSVDLGHRYAAACAVWEAISTKELHAACALAGCGGPSREALCWFVPRGKHGDKPGRVVYRRIGDETLPDGSPHPAPWARLDRQFLIKLQGEDEPARSATSAERPAVEALDDQLGYQRREPRKAADWRIDELMSDVVRTVRLALRNHGAYARIANGLIAAERHGMGNRPPVKLEGDALVEHLVGLLDIWHELAKSSRWKDAFAGKAWEQHIEPRLAGIALEEDVEDMTGPQRKAARAERRKQLTSVAEQLAKESRVQLSAAWQQAWLARDVQWQKRLRWLSRWIMPRGKDENGKKRKSDRSVRNVGGLSLNRIATFKSLYQVQKAFFTRQKPDGKKPEPAGEGFGQRTLDALEQMRQNRVKQLASRIAEAALGVGVERSRTEKGKQLKRPRERIADPRFAPCHAVVIENLTHYRPDELQTRRENRQLMTWASAQVKKHLTDQCQLHGLHLREVQPGYTSRQDFRTGAPGIRCVDVPVAAFLGEPGDKPGRHVRQAIRNLLKDVSTDDWSMKFELARAKVCENAGTAWDRYVLDLFDHLSKPTDMPAEKVASRFARIPQKGGDVFVTAHDVSSNGVTKGPPGVQADLNAAGNIGLKALLDPDWHGAWWYIPASLDANGWRIPNDKSTTGAACLKDWRVGEMTSGRYKSEAVGGRALNLADEAEVQAAARLVVSAKASLDAAKKETGKAKRGKSSLSHEAALELEATAKTAHDGAKKHHATARKGANAKAIVNLWRFLSSQRPHDCEWREYAAFENLVRWRAIQQLRRSVGLPVNSGDDSV